MGNPETDLGGRLASLDMLELVFEASWIVQAVLLLLVLLSVFSWAVILYKARELRRAEQDSEAFLEVYHDGSLEETFDAARTLDRSPLASMFAASYGELRRMARGTGGAVTLDENKLSALTSRAHWAGSREAKQLERGLTFLATTGSSAPFIGLFGTVIGIIDAFQGIGRAGSASLAVVAPGIAEALIATAAGLFAAIPATIYYNIYVGKLRAVVSSIDLFGTEFEAALRRFAAPGETPRPLRAQGK
jgi:biopolymer transport protein TolQ